MPRSVTNTKPGKRRAKWLATAVAAPLMALPTVGAATSYATELALLPAGPARVLTLSLVPGGNDDDLQGVLCETPRTCHSVNYSYLFRPTGVASLDRALLDGTTGQQIIFAYSQGARVAALWMEQRAGTEGAPAPADLSFVLMGNPSRQYGGADGSSHAIPETDYKILDVSQEYDGASDFPDNPFNLLALLNASAGLIFVHQEYEDVDIYDPANYVWTEGNTTYVFVPTANLPLLRPLRWLGLGDLADRLNGPLKNIVDRAYDRYYLPDLPGLPPVDPEPEPEVPPAEPEPEPTDPEPEPPETVTPDTAQWVSGHTTEHVAAVTAPPPDTAPQPETTDPDADFDLPDGSESKDEDAGEQDPEDTPESDETTEASEPAAEETESGQDETGEDDNEPAQSRAAPSSSDGADAAGSGDKKAAGNDK